MASLNIPKSKYITDPNNANDHKRTTTGRDTLRLGTVPSTTLLTVEISDTATVVIEYSEDEAIYIPVATLTETGGVQFAIPASVLGVNVTSLSAGYVRVIARTIVLDNIPSQTLILYGPTLVTSPILSSASHHDLTGLTDGDDHTQYVLASGARVMSGAIDLTGIAAGSPSVKANATSDTPVVAFTDSGAANHAPTTAPAGYIEILVGASARYIPFWA